jgi:hypothetical protein
MGQVVQQPSSAELQAYFDLLCAAFQHAADHSAGPEGVFQYGEFRVKIAFAGSGLAKMLLPAIAHASQPSGKAPEFSIFAWDSATTGCELPFILANHVQLLKRDWGAYLDSRGGISHLSGDEINSTLHIGAAGAGLSVYHSRLRQALFWTEDATLIPYYEQGAPFRTIFNWMVNDGNHILVHAGAVGLPEGGVLLAGKGGSGKSTTALACLQAGLFFASDDYCLVALNGQPEVYCLYNTAKLIGSQDIERFPAIAENFEVRDQLDPKSKPMIFLHQHMPARVINRLPLKAILLPRITNGKHTSLRPANPAAALAAIAPSSIFQLPGAGKRTMAAISRLSQSLPCLWLEVGTDLREIPRVIKAFLQQAPEA